MAARNFRGETAYHAGLSAESQIARDYQVRGYRLLKERWRGAAGEIDLIVANRDCVVFVEVKKARDFATAAARITRRQMDRIAGSAEEYLAKMPDAPAGARIDAALVNDTGFFEIVENAFCQ